MSDSDVREWSQVCGEERRVTVSVEASIHHDPPMFCSRLIVMLLSFIRYYIERFHARLPEPNCK